MLLLFLWLFSPFLLALAGYFQAKPGLCLNMATDTSISDLVLLFWCFIILTLAISPSILLALAG